MTAAAAAATGHVASRAITIPASMFAMVMGPNLSHREVESGLKNYFLRSGILSDDDKFSFNGETAYITGNLSTYEKLLALVLKHSAAPMMRTQDGRPINPEAPETNPQDAHDAVIPLHPAMSRGGKLIYVEDAAELPPGARLLDDILKTPAETRGGEPPIQSDGRSPFASATPPRP